MSNGKRLRAFRFGATVGASKTQQKTIFLLTNLQNVI